MENNLNTKVVSRSALLLCLSMILSYIESLIPLSVGVPGVKIGLPNLVIMFAVYKFGFRPAITISVLRVILISILFGNVMTLAYSAAGALLSLIVMYCCMKTNKLSCIGVSVLGGVSHNVGQILVAIAVLETSGLLYYLPVLCISGTVAGIVIGIVSSILINRIKIKEYD